MATIPTVFLDFDWTLVKPKDGRRFPKAVSDWEWWNPTVPEVVRGWHQEGYKLVIVTNQSKPWKEEQIKEAVAALNVPITICIAWNKEEYKPSRALYEREFPDDNLNRDRSFMVGDAMGRRDDFADSDLKFATNIGIPCKPPEEVFKMEAAAAAAAATTTATATWCRREQEVIIMVGPPGSGKTTVADSLEEFGYIVLHGDEYKTSKKMIAIAKDLVNSGKSIIFDATNPSAEKRAEYVQFAKSNGLPVRCMYMTTSLDLARERNSRREKPVPTIVYSMYRKNFEMPTSEEGFEVVEI